MSVDLTKRQREIFDYIRRYLRKYGYPPTVREIGNALGLHSPSTVHAHLAKLEQIGMLRRDPTKPRAIELMVGKARRALKGPGDPGGRKRRGAASRYSPRRTSRTTTRCRR